MGNKSRGKKRPKATESPNGTGRDPRNLAGGKEGKRVPQTVVQPGAQQDDHPKFSFRYADREYPHDWHDPQYAGTFLDFIHSFGRSTWKELRGQRTGRNRRRVRYHSHEFDDLAKAAQERIQAKSLDETFNEIFRYYVSSTERVWGFEREKVFYVLWWDPFHEVYPVEKG